MRKNRGRHRVLVLLLTVILLLLFAGQSLLAATVEENSAERAGATTSVSSDSSVPMETDESVQETEATSTTEETIPTQDSMPTEATATTTDKVGESTESKTETTTITETRQSRGTSITTSPSTTPAVEEPTEATSTATETEETEETEETKEEMPEQMFALMALPWNATITAYPSLRLRITPDTTYSSKGSYPTNSRLQVIGYVDNGESVNNNSRWYRVKMESDGQEGYVSAEYVKLDEGFTPQPYVAPLPVDPVITPLTDAEFQALLNKEFPRSYHAALKSLHKKFPYWTFSAKHINHDWKYIVSRLSPGYKSMVPIKRVTSMKSYAKDSYDFRTDSWKALDAGFTGASQAAIQHYLDPRNFLDQTGIFQFENLSYNSKFQTLAGIKKILKGTFMDPASKSGMVDSLGRIVYRDNKGQKITLNKTYAEVFLEAARVSNASPYFLASRVIQEVGRAGSASVRGTHATYPGIYNYYNIGATASTNPITNGLRYASVTGTYSRPWNNPEKAIIGGASWIASGYINRGQDSLYLQKYDFVGFWHQYMANIQAPPAEASTVMRNYLEMGMLQHPFHFKIPVMKNMPSKPIARPSDNLSRNNWLRSISGPATLSPAFNPEIYNYTLTLNAPVSQISLSGIPYHGKADIVTEVNGTKVAGAIPLPQAPGELKVTLVVRAEKRDAQRRYTIIVKHQGGGTGKLLPLQSSVYSFDGGVLAGLNPKKNRHYAENILRDLKTTSSDYSLRIKDKDGRIVTTGIVSTGCTLEIIRTGQSTPEFSLPIIMYGDVNGNSVINIADLTLVVEHFFARRKLVGSQLLAADVNNNGIANIADVTIIAEYFFGRMEIPSNR
ncbi:MAG TPA: SH3 domain-containing protein [Clostridiaceae bacterium]|nr:SH3 domain-containing protein [Clostridiaceae bacterium]